MQVEMTGTTLGTFAAGAPGISKFLQFAGMKEVPLSKCAVNAAAWTHPTVPVDQIGPLRHLEMVNDGTNDWPVISDCVEGEAFLYVDETDGLPVAGAWNAADTENGFTIDSVVPNAGWAWYPITDVTKTVDLAAPVAAPDVMLAGTLIEGTISGARAQVAKATVAGDTTLELRPVRGRFVDNDLIGRLDTNVSTNSNVATPTNERFVQWPSASTRINRDGRASDALGARYNVAFDFQLRQSVKANFTLQGQLGNPLDTPIVPGATPDLQDPPLWHTSLVGWANNERIGAIPFNPTKKYHEYDYEQEACLNSFQIDLGGWACPCATVLRRSTVSRRCSATPVRGPQL